MPAIGLAPGEERVPEVQGRRGAEPDEVVGLDDSPDAGADRHLPCVLRPVYRAAHLQSGVAHGPNPFKADLEVTVNG